MGRYRESGWSDGLEGLGLMVAGLAGAVTVAIAVTSGVLGRRSRALVAVGLGDRG